MPQMNLVAGARQPLQSPVRSEDHAYMGLIYNSQEGLGFQLIRFSDCDKAANRLPDSAAAKPLRVDMPRYVVKDPKLTHSFVNKGICRKLPGFLSLRQGFSHAAAEPSHASQVCDGPRRAAVKVAVLMMGSV